MTKEVVIHGEDTFEFRDDDEIDTIVGNEVRDACFYLLTIKR